MRILVESLKRLFGKGDLTKEQIAERVERNSISADEYKYITSKVYKA